MENELKIKSSALNAVSRMFYCSYYVDIKANTVMELHTYVKEVHSAIGDYGDASKIIDIFCNKLVLPQYKENLKEFTDFSTLQTRLKGKDYISFDYEGVYSGWSEAIFVEVDKDDEGSLYHVMFLVRDIGEHKKNELEITKSLVNSYETTKAELDFEKMAINSIQKTLKSGFWSMILDKNFKTIKCSWTESFKKMLGYDENDDVPEMARFFEEITHNDDQALITEDMLCKLTENSNEASYDAEYRLCTKEGKWRWYRSVGRILVREDHSYVIFGLLSDIDSIKKSEKKLKEETKKRKEQFSVLKSLADFYLSMHMIDLNNDSCIEYNSNKYISKWTSMYKSATEMMKAAMMHTADEDYRDMILEFTDLTTISERMKNHKQLSCEFIGIHFGWIKAEFIVVSRNENGLPAKLIFTTLIIDDEKKREQELITKSCTDSLTKLYNRKAYDEDLEGYNKDNNPNLVFISMDLNGLKSVNDTYGHLAGDKLIKAAARCIKHVYGSHGKIYRIGGDEFAVIISVDYFSIESLFTEFENACESWNKQLNSKFELKVSYGFAAKSDYKNSTVLDLSRIADKKMYEAKAAYYKNNGIDRRKR